MPRISYQDEAEIEWYLSAGTSTFYHSNFGDMLARAHVAHYDSMGEPIAIPTRKDEWRYITLPKDGAPAAYEPDSEVLDRFGRISRRMLACERYDRLGAKALEVYYGDEGARWNRTPKKSTEHKLTPISRAHCLASITREGQRILSKNPGHPDLRPNEQLAILRQRADTPVRLRRSLDKMAHQIAELTVHMCDTWHAGYTAGWYKGVE